MKIREVRATPVAVPRLAQFLPKTAHGETSVSQYVIIEIETEDGVVGLGEATCSPLWNGEEARSTTYIVRECIDALLRGCDASQWTRIASRIASLTRERPFLRAGIEMACLDIVGRYAGLPASTLLGGALGERIETKFVLPARDPARVADMARQASEHGVQAVKVKVGTGLDDDMTRVRQVRDVLGDTMRLTVDANEGWQPFEARRAIPVCNDLQVIGLEQPLSRCAWAATAQLRATADAVLFGDEAIWTLADVLRAGETGAFDAVSLYPGKCGGMREALHMARVAESMGMTVVFGSNLELGIGSAALAHAAVACSNLDSAVPSDVIGPLYFESSLVTDDSFVGWDGARCPSGPGLGVDLDGDALQRYQFDG